MGGVGRWSKGETGSHTIHVIKAEYIKKEKLTYPKAAVIHCRILLRNHLMSAAADTATGQCPACILRKRKDRNDYYKA